jgi:hypothetical protein
MFDKITNWPFLQEPAYRWFMFVGMMLLLFTAWAIILGYMKKAG